MGRCLQICILLIALLLGAHNGYAQKEEKGKAKITFVSKDDDHARTYIGKLRRGDLQSLRYELKRYNSGTANEVNVDDKSLSKKGYVDRIMLSGRGRDRRKSDKAAQKDLYGNYEVKDTLMLAEVKEKKKKAATAKALAKNSDGNYQNYDNEQTHKNSSSLGRYFKVSKKRRLRNGNFFRKPSGNITLVIVYDVRVGKTISTYVDVVDGYLKGNANYNLKYHGSGAFRHYYLEYVSKRK